MENTYTANEILRSYTMDYTAQVEHARNAAGTWFKRVQYRDARYGYKWSAWTATSNGPINGFPNGKMARLPKVAS